MSSSGIVAPSYAVAAFVTHRPGSGSHFSLSIGARHRRTDTAGLTKSMDFIGARSLYFPKACKQSGIDVASSSPRSADQEVTFGTYRLLRSQQLLLEGERAVPVGSRALALLVALVEKAGEVVSKEELIAKVWPGTIVDEGNLRVHMAALRRALGEGQGGNRYVTTIPGRGYSFVAPVVFRDPKVQQAQRPSANRDLPPAVAGMVGRAEVVATLATQIPQRRFVTLVGPGGIGKTTVAIAVAHKLSEHYSDGIAFVDLVPLSDPMLLVSKLASVLDLFIHSGEPLSGLVAYLRTKELLLVLDNCEHVIESAASLADEIYKNCAGVNLLATSREPLRATGERVHRLAPLESAPISTTLTAAQALTFAGIQLFVDRAAAASGEFKLTDTDAPVVADVCRRLDGIPLAIEFAAARATTLGIRQVASRLDDRFGVLTGGRRTALPRHRTLRATLDWSYELLPASEQELLRRLAVFAGWFTLEAATAVIIDIGDDASTVVEGIANLVAKSFVMLDEPASVSHWRLLQTIRAYAREKLDESGERDTFARRHAEYFCKLFQRAEVEWETRSTNEWVVAYDVQIDDVRIAIDWAFSQSGDEGIGVALTVAALPLWFQLSLINECRSRVERALAALETGPIKGDQRTMKLHAALGWSLMYTSGQARETGAAWATALRFAEENSDTEYCLRALWGLWAGRINNGQFSEALALARRFASLAAVAADGVDRYVGDRMIGVCLHFLGDQPEARRHIQRMLERYITPTSRSDAVRFQFDQQVTGRITLSRVLWLQGLPDQAMRVVQDNIDHALIVGHVLSLCNALAQAACPVALMAGALPEAERFTSMLLQQTERHSLEIWHSYGNCFMGELLIRSGDLNAGLTLLQPAVAELRKAKFVQYHTAFLRTLAESLGQARRVAEGIEAIDEALTISERNEERWCLPELLRVKGDLLAQEAQNDTTEAETHYARSLHLAQKQGALSWELRTATSLAGVRIDQGRPDDARQILAPVYDRFAEGFETMDLRRARAILESLRGNGL